MLEHLEFVAYSHLSLLGSPTFYIASDVTLLLELDLSTAITGSQKPFIYGGWSMCFFGLQNLRYYSLPL